MIYTMREGIVDRAKDRLLRNNEGISTGFYDLDLSLGGGFQNGYLYVLGSRPAMGKTSFALCLTSNICRQGKKVSYYSLGMNAEDLIKRLIMLETLNDRSEYDDAARRIKEYRLLINDDPYRDEEDADLIIIDCLQLLGTIGDENDRWEHICRKLKEKARMRQIPILLISDLSQTIEQREVSNRRPLMCDLHEWDAAAVYADVVMFLYRDEYYEPDTELKSIAEIRIAKNVTRPVGECRLAYIVPGRFCNIQSKEG